MTDAAAGTAADDDDRNISMVYTLLVDIVYQSAYTSQFIWLTSRIPELSLADRIFSCFSLIFSSWIRAVD